MDTPHNISIAQPDITELELKYITQAVKSNELSSQGFFVNKFEKSFADFCEAKYATTCMNGTVALHLALIGVGVCAHDEVIVPALTYVSTANAVVHAGGTPVFVDVHPDHWGMDPEEVRKKITPKTKAIIAVHLYGHPADMDPLLEICKEFGIKLIEDATEAHGAKYKGKTVGSIGSVGTFSFFGNKILTTGEGGMVTSNDQEIVDKINIYKNHGNNPNKRYFHKVIGYNYRMTNLQAAIGLAQVERAHEILAKKRAIAKLYNAGLKNLPLKVQPNMTWAEPVNWMNCIVLDDTTLPRDQMQSDLMKLGIDTRPFFEPIPYLDIYGNSGYFPISKKLSSRGINLPSSSKLQEDEISYIISAITNILT